ncbi:MAG: hypothetical protein HYS18_06130 [Burkholderiales bacterium]|nr:hypothetical protein [Burkholderiales bacterium]
MLINQIGLTNFLCEGYEKAEKKTEWIPLYRGNEIWLGGHSAAVQLRNGAGKTSIVDASLYLLSRHSELKTRILKRLAPSTKTWSHVRIQFCKRTGDPRQAGLTSFAEADFPGEKYVVGMCGYRDEQEPHFYYYPGDFAAAPTYLIEGTKRRLVDNDTFKQSVKRIDGFRWNAWGRLKDWRSFVDEFISIDVVDENVDFQLAGGGDASATLQKVVCRHEEDYDAAFFRTVIAPELLKDAMGEEGDDGERRFEKTVVRSLQGIARTTVEAEAFEREAQSAELALTHLDPVIDRANSVIEASRAEGAATDEIGKAASFIQHIAEKDPIPGLPRLPNWNSLDKRVANVLQYMVLTSSDCLLTTRGLEELTGVLVKHINETASRQNIFGKELPSQVLDFKCDFKFSEAAAWGGTRKPQTGYSEEAALALLTKLEGAAKKNLDGVPAAITNAFFIARGLDTNPYRTKLADARNQLAKAAEAQIQAAAEFEEADLELSKYHKQQGEVAENQTAYQDFLSHANEFPEHLRDSPRLAETWMLAERSAKQEERDVHIRKEGTLKAPYADWRHLKEFYGDVQLVDAMQALNADKAALEQSKALAAAEKDTADERQRLAHQAREDHIEKKVALSPKFEIWKNLKKRYQNAELTDALRMLEGEKPILEEGRNAAATNEREILQRRDELQIRLKAKDRELEACRITVGKLEDLSQYSAAFRTIFGDVDPNTINPRQEESRAQAQQQALKIELAAQVQTSASLKKLRESADAFRNEFGDVDALALDPSADLDRHRTAIADLNLILQKHQPLATALVSFAKTYPNKAPAQWLIEADMNRGVLSARKVEAQTQIGECQRQLDALENHSVADDRIFADALAELDKAGIKYSRLYEIVNQEAANETKKADLLSVFSATLSAPIFANVESARMAAVLLDEKRVTVPVFLLDPLRAFFAQATIQKYSDFASATFFAGRRTRQVDILLNPKLIQEEKVRITESLKRLTNSVQLIDDELSKIEVAGEQVQFALYAKRAVDEGSVPIAQQAEAELAALSVHSSELERRASKENHALIAETIRFNELGGHAALNVLLEKSLPEQERAIENVENILNEVRKKTTNAALTALNNVRSYLSLGGDTELEARRAALTTLMQEHAEIEERFELINTQFIEAAVANRQAERILSEFMETFESQRQQLATSIEFEISHLAFMQTVEQTESTLTQSLDYAKAQARDADKERSRAESTLLSFIGQYENAHSRLKAAIEFETSELAFMQTASQTLRTISATLDSIESLLKINFERAQLYRDRDIADAIDYATLIGNAEAKKKLASTKGKLAVDAQHDANGWINKWNTLSMCLHELCLGIVKQSNKLASVKEVVQERTAFLSPDAHPLAPEIETLRLRFLAKEPAADIESLIRDLNNQFEQINIDVQVRELTTQSALLRKAKSEFDAKRNEFCSKARNKEISGLFELEIAHVERANTLAELTAVRQISAGVRIRIDEARKHVEDKKATIEEASKATISNLVSFARGAEANLKTLDAVMARTPNARFFVEAEVASEETIRQMVTSLLERIQDREKGAIANSAATALATTRRDVEYMRMVHEVIYEDIFIDARIHFTINAIWKGDKSRLVGDIPSGGQKTALGMLWMIKQSDYALEIVLRDRASSAKERQRLAGRRDRVLFFDGLFSNLTDERIIDDVFQGLKNVVGHFQLIGLIHNPNYINNTDVFPVHLVGAKIGETFMAVEPWQEGGETTIFKSYYKPKQKDLHA